MRREERCRYQTEGKNVAFIRLFVIDRHGIIRTRIEGAWSIAELERALREVKRR